MTQNEWKERIQGLLRSNDMALYKAIVILYNRTHSVSPDGKGYSRVDKDFFSPLAEKIKMGVRPGTTDTAIARNKMMKYWKQLMEVAKAKEEGKNVQKEDNTEG